MKWTGLNFEIKVEETIKSKIFRKEVLWMSSLDLQMIAKSGGNLVVEAKSYSALDLKLVAAAGKENGATLTIMGAGKFSSLDCQLIAKANPGHVTFNFC